MSAEEWLEKWCQEIPPLEDDAVERILELLELK